MRIRARLFLRLLVLATVLAAGIGAGHGFAPELNAAPANKSECGQSEEEKQEKRRTDWGHTVFGKGSGSPFYRL